MAVGTDLSWEVRSQDEHFHSLFSVDLIGKPHDHWLMTWKSQVANEHIGS